MTQSTEQSTIWLSKAAFDQLSAELEDMKGPQRQKIVAEISAARDEGDLKENGGYHAAREAQGRLEGEIAQLEATLLKADTTEPPADGTVAPGTVVTYKYEGDADDEAETFLLGAREIEPEGLTVYSPQSPLGAAIIDHKVGETVEYSAPNGKTLKVEIVDAVPFTG